MEVREAITRERESVLKSIGLALAKFSSRDLAFRAPADAPEAYRRLRLDFNAAMSEIEASMSAVTGAAASIEPRKKAAGLVQAAGRFQITGSEQTTRRPARRRGKQFAPAPMLKNRAGGGSAVRAVSRRGRLERIPVASLAA